MKRSCNGQSRAAPGIVPRGAENPFIAAFGQLEKTGATPHPAEMAAQDL